MKKINAILALTALVGALSFSSCTKDEATTDTGITYSTPAEGKASVSTDSIILVKFTVKAAADLKTVSGKVAYDGGVAATLDLSPGDSKTTDSTLASGTGKTFEFTTAIVTRSTAGKEVYTYTFKDKDGKTTDATITLTVTAATAKVDIYTAKLLGGQSNTSNGSFFNSSEGLVYNQADAKTNAGKVDFLFYYGATNKATLAAPNDTNAAKIYKGTATSLETWSVKNATMFKTTTVTAAQFDAITANDDAVITTAATGANLTRAQELAVGNVVAFVTAGNKKGLAKVSAITAATDGSITIDVKVQK